METPPRHQEPQRTCTRSSPCHHQGCLVCHTPTNHVHNRDPNHLIQCLTRQFLQAIHRNDVYTIETFNGVYKYCMKSYPDLLTCDRSALSAARRTAMDLLNSCTNMSVPPSNPNPPTNPASPLKPDPPNSLEYPTEPDPHTHPFHLSNHDPPTNPGPPIEPALAANPASPLKPDPSNNLEPPTKPDPPTYPIPPSNQSSLSAQTRSSIQSGEPCRT